MNTLIKTYYVPEGALEFIFVYDSEVATISNFSITSLSPLKYGYDSADPKEISIYPSNIEIEIDDFEGDNYSAFKSFLESYNVSYPFNMYEILYLVIKLNSQILFKGILDEVNSDNEKLSITLAFVDGINKYKDVPVYNPALLKKLYEYNLIPARIVYQGFSEAARAYGFGSIDYKTVGILPANVITPGYMLNNITTGDQDTRLSSVIYRMIKSLRDDLSVEFDNQYKYGNTSTEIGDMVDITQLNIRRILSTLFGRYVVIKKLLGRINQIGELSTTPDYAKPDKFDLVYEDTGYKVYYHNFSGTVSQKKFEKGLDEKTISEILKVLAKNTFSYFGLKNQNTLFFRHKRFLSEPIELNGIIKMSKVLTVDRVCYVEITDYYTDNYGSDGDNISTDKLTYKIPMNAFPTDNGYEYRLNYYYGSTEIPVIHFYDPQIDYRDLPQEVISRAEWEQHKNFRDQYEFELQGIDYEFDATYSVNYGNYQGKFRPITIEKDLLNSKTKMTALEIG